MITAVDTNILLDILIPNAPHGDISEKSLTVSLESGSVIISEAVYTELAVHFATRIKIDRFLEESNIRLNPSCTDALFLAGKAWREYLQRRTNSLICTKCGATQESRCVKCGSDFLPRQHVIADFIIGAHARIHADLLLTRDRGYYRTYFPDLQTVSSQ